MKAVKYSFKILIIIIIFSTSIYFNLTTKEDDSISSNAKVIAEGILTEIAGGGTREIQFPSGYAIKNPVWIVAPPASNTIIFLRTNDFSLKDFINKLVHIEGEFTSVPGKKMSQIGYTKPYDEIIVDTIYSIN